MKIDTTRSWSLILPALLLAHSVFGATEFFENFDTMSLPATLEESSCCSSVSFATSAAVFPGVGDLERVFLRTVEDDFHATSFIFEITVTLTDGFLGPGTAFIGLGRGEPLLSRWGEPRDGPHLFLRVFPSDQSSGAISVIDDGVDFFSSTAGAAGAGTHRLRMIWKAETEEATFQIHKNYAGGVFVPSTATGPIDGSNNSFIATDSRIFFGAASRVTFDDLSVTFPKADNLFADSFEDLDPD